MPLILLVILIFALSRGFQRVLTFLALEEINGWTLTALSLLLACLVWLPIAHYKKWLVLDKKLWYRSIPLSIMNIAIPGVAFTFAQLFVSAGVAALFVAFLPVLVAILGLFVLKEKIAKKSLIGISLATLGVTILSISRNGSLDATNWPLGVILLTIGVISAAIVYVGWKKLLAERPAVELLAPQLAISTLIIIPIALIFATDKPLLSGTPWLLILLLGITNYIIPQLAMLWLLSKTTVIKSALANYLAPVFTVVLGYIILNQAITIPIIISGVLIIGGAFLINIDKAKKNKIPG